MAMQREVACQDAGRTRLSTSLKKSQYLLATTRQPYLEAANAAPRADRAAGAWSDFIIASIRACSDVVSTRYA